MDTVNPHTNDFPDGIRSNGFDSIHQRDLSGSVAGLMATHVLTNPAAAAIKMDAAERSGGQL